MKKLDNVADVYPLTPTQQGMLYHTLQSPSSEVYLEQIRATLNGPLNVSAFQEAWERIVERHPVLRTAFLWDGLDTPLQVVRQQVTIPWEFIDWRNRTGDIDSQLALLAADDQRKGFDLGRAPLIRMVLVRLGEASHHFIWNFHHLLTDGWSTHQIIKELFQVYEALVQDREADLPAVRPFRNYVAWLQKQNLDAAEQFWRRELSGFTAPTSLHIDIPAPAADFSYADTDTFLSRETSAALRAVAQKHRLTLNSIIQAAWGLLLSRYSGEDDVLFGMTVSGRPAALPGVEQMVGLFINSLPLRLKIDEDAPLLPWLQELQAHLLELRQHEHTPLVRVQQWSDLPAGQSLFETLVVYENYPVPEDDDVRTLHIGELLYREQSNYPLAFLVVPGERLRLLIIYNPHRFPQEAVERLLGHMETLLGGIAANPDGRLRDLPLLTPAERKQQLVTWNDTTAPLPGEQTVPDLIAAHARSAPESAAVRFAGETLTYAELHRRAARLATFLQQQGAGPGDLVALELPRSLEMVVGIVGVLHAGAAYLPVDPAYPADRRRQIIADAQPVVTLTGEDVRRVAGDAAGDGRTGHHPIEPNALAYTIYTSGSTGKPKGVAVTHRNLLASTLARLNVYDKPVERFLLLSSFSFDSSVAGIFWTLVQGGTLVLPETDEEKDVQRVAQLIDDERVTHTLALPSLYRLLLTFAPEKSLDSLQTVIVAGEACPPDLGTLHYGRLPRTDLYNEYGPTEATVWCSVYQLPRIQDGGPVPIGRPIPNSQLLVLDEKQRLLPIGVPGELYVCGAGVTPGYLRKPELTAERFVDLSAPHPDLPFPGRAYRTGDLVKWLPDGNLAFLGRVDNQVKIRGYRIEPGEIEVVLEQHPAVRMAAVAPWDRDGDKRLVGYLEPAAGREIIVNELKDFLEQRLPDYMVPPNFQILAELPRMPNGKIDRRRLPEPEAMGVEERPYTPPRTPLEETLADIWAKVLRLPRVGIHDKFFELGGDSILSIQAIARARQAGLSLTPRQLFNEQTIARLAAAAAQTETNETQAEDTSGPIPLTPIQHWFFEQELVEASQWSQASWFSIETSIHAAHLEEALIALADHHPQLRARFSRTADGRQQEINPDRPQGLLQRISAADMPPAAQEKVMAAALTERVARFDLAAGNLFQGILFDLGPERRPRLLLVAHHLVIDAVSWRILIADLAAAYAQINAGQPLSLPAPHTSYAQWAAALQRLTKEREIQQQLPFWREMSATVTPLPAAAADQATNTEENTAFITAELDATQTDALLREAHEAYHTRMDDLLLTALVQVVTSWTGNQSQQIMLERHGREDLADTLDVSQTIGWFTALFPVTLTLQDPADPGSSIRQIKEQLRRVPQNGLGYGMLRYLGAPQSLAGRAQPPLLFAYLGQMDSDAGAEGPFRPVSAALRPAYGRKNRRAHLLDINSRVVDGRLQVTWQYPSTIFAAAQIQKLAEMYINALAELIAHCTTAGTSRHTPSDFPLSNLEQDELDSLSALLDELE